MSATMNATGSRVAIVVPAFNEASTIGPLVRRIREVMPHADVVVMDDGSTDGTSAAAEAAGAQVLRHPYNKGNGAAVKTALRSLSAERIIIIDADGQHPPEMLPALADALDAYDLVVGARTADSDARRNRRFGNWVFCALASFLTDRTIPDLTSGFRAFYRQKALEFVHLYPNGFSFPTTSTLAFISAGYNVKFIPIVAAQRSEETSSHIRPLQDGFRFILMIVRIASMINPLRVFVPAAVVTLVAGIVWNVRTIYSTHQVSAAGAFLVGAALNILFFGIVVDQLAAIRLKGRD
jgi:glycosyltransferase involved in cell wall biosynthesis